MGPAGDLGEARDCGPRIGAEQALEARIAVAVEEALAAFEQGGGVHALAVGRVEIQSRRRGRSRPGPLVAHKRPQPTGLGLAAARIEHGDGGVVGVQRAAGGYVPADRLGEGSEQEGQAPHPFGHHRPVQIEAAAGIDVALAIERDVIAELGDRHMGEQLGTGKGPLDGQGRHGRLSDGLAGAAADLGPDVDHDLEVRRHIFQHLALVLADHREPGPAA